MNPLVNSLLNVVLILVCVVFGAALLTCLERRLRGLNDAYLAFGKIAVAPTVSVPLAPCRLLLT